MTDDTVQTGQRTSGRADEAPDFQITDLVDLRLHQSSAINQLWTTYVVATFAAVTFAITAGKESPLLLYAGAVGFSAFTAGHMMLVWTTLKQMKLAAEDIRDSLQGAAHPRARARLALPVMRWPSVTCHIIIDACVIGAFVYRIATLAPARPS